MVPLETIVCAIFSHMQWLKTGYTDINPSFDVLRKVCPRRNLRYTKDSRRIKELADMFKPILPMLAGLLCCFSVFSQDVELQADHPETYTVVRGDTLWGIAERFLQNPWLWPEIWQANPQIENPHLIYPGDQINLIYVDGQPRLALKRAERPTVHLSPKIRTTPLAEAIKPIKLEKIQHYLTKRAILSEAEIAELPYVVAIEEEHTIGAEGLRVYVRGLDAKLGQTFSLVRPTLRFTEVPTTWPYDEAETFEPRHEEWTNPAGPSMWDMTARFWQSHFTLGYHKNTVILGTEVVATGVGEVTATGDPSTLLLTTAHRAVTIGDLVMPPLSGFYDAEYMPGRPEVEPDNMRVIAISSSSYAAGPTDVVALNRGSSDGIKHGDVFAVYRPGAWVHDAVKYPKDDVNTYFSRTRREAAKVKLPDEYTAHLMIFKTFDRVSYGLVMRAQRAVKVMDLLKAP